MVRVVKIELNEEGIREMLKSEYVMNSVKNAANNIAENSLGFFDVKMAEGKKRGWASITCADELTYWDNIKNSPNIKDVALKMCHPREKR